MLLAYMCGVVGARRNHCSELVSGTLIHVKVTRLEIHGNCVCRYGCERAYLKRNKSFSSIVVSEYRSDRDTHLLHCDSIDAAYCITYVLCRKIK